MFLIVEQSLSVCRCVSGSEQQRVQMLFLSQEALKRVKFVGSLFT